MLSTSGWLRITAANGLGIPYLGYLELPVETMGITLPECGFLVVRDVQNSSAVPALIGMNIISRCRQLVHAEFDTTLGGELESDWREVFQHMQSVSQTKKQVVAHIAGKETVHIPAWSVSTLMVWGKGNRCLEGSSDLLLEPGKFPLPQGLIVVPSLVSTSAPLFPVRVVNLSTEDIWLQPRTRLGILSPVESLCSGEGCEVKFKRVAAGVEEITVSTEESQVGAEGLPDLLTELSLGGTAERQAELKELLLRYVNVFAVSDEELGFSDKVQHKIHLVDDVPITQPYRRIPPTQYGEVREHITKLLQKGVIKPSSRPYASPIVLVRKTDGNLRLCVDYT
ncbi:uncharacterized protein [Paramisgurnus dabryanus]|uniref:uncharacterized protein n=1 Tax=Paramisgurnus dabryanus TaxID=90735 RepID=UPI003CCFBCA2